MADDVVINYLLELLDESENSFKNELKMDKSLDKHRNIYYELEKLVDEYLDGYVENRFITLAGLRGVGKTTALYQIYFYLINKKKIDKNRVLYIPADELKYIKTNLYDTIKTFIEEIHHSYPGNLKEKLFILVDEAQSESDWSSIGKIFYDKTHNIFMIFTGSSAISFEVNVDAVRRIKKESVFPLSFNEYIYLKHNITPPEDYEKDLVDLFFSGDIEKIMLKQNEMSMKLLTLKKPIRKELGDFLLYGDFPYGVAMNKYETSRRTLSMINRIIVKDVFSLKSFNTDSIATITEIITYVALQFPGGTSFRKLATILSKSTKAIRDILEVLEKTHLLFSVKPYGDPGVTIRKPWKYYFLSPSINGTLRKRFGGFSEDNPQFLGILAENYVASYFFKLKNTEDRYLNIYYDPDENGVDFLLDLYNKIIPVEVSMGKKDKKQIKKAIAKYKSDYGIIISNTVERIRKEEDVIYIPLIAIS